MRYDSYQRGGARRQRDPVSGLHLVLMLVSAGLLILSRVDHPVTTALEQGARQLAQPPFGLIAEMARPVRQVVHNAARYLTVETELQRLERELASLNNLLQRAGGLEGRNRELARLARLVNEAQVDAMTVEVVAGRQGLFSQSVMIGAGTRQGVRYGQPVFSGDGLFGRIVEVEETQARVLMLNDGSSRIAVEVGERRRPALLVGDNRPMPRLVYLAPDEAVAPGETVITSGASGAFPRGIAVGRVARAGEDVRVKTDSVLVAGRYLTVMAYAVASGLQSDSGVDEGAKGAGASKRHGAANARREEALR